MSKHRLALAALAATCAACAPSSAPTTSTPQSDEPLTIVRRAAASRGWPEGRVTLERRSGLEAPIGDYRLRLDGLRVAGVGAKVVDGKALITPIRVEPDAQVTGRAVLTASEAVARAVASFPANQRLTVERDERMVLPELSADGARVVRLTLSHRVLVDDGRARWLIDVDPSDGRIRGRRELVWLQQKGPTPPRWDELRPITGHGRLNGTQQLVVSWNTDYEEYELIDQNNNSYHRGGGMLLSSDDAEIGDGQPFVPSEATDVNVETTAVDVMTAARYAFLSYQQLFQQDGPYGQRRELRFYIDPSSSRTAYYSHNPTGGSVTIGPYVSFFEKTETPPMAAAIDVVAHEIGHANFMTFAEPDELDLAPEGEPTERDALNEAHGDIMGTLAEWTKGPPDGVTRSGRGGTWPELLSLGEALGAPRRSMLTPYQPVYTSWFDLSDPHLATGPICRMFTLLAWGIAPMPLGLAGEPGPWTADAIPEGMAGIGVVKAARVWRDAVKLLPPGATFAVARDAAISAAERLYGFDDEAPRAVADAFAAVQIGQRADRVPPTVTLSATQIWEGVRVSWAVSDNRPLAPRRSPELVAGGQSYLPGGASGTINVPISTLTDGANTFTLTAWDDAGNRVVRSIQVTVDKRGPVAAVTQDGAPKTPRLVVAASDPAGVHHVEFLRAGVLVASTIAVPYQAIFDTSTWPDGIHPIAIRIFDAYGNVTELNHTIRADNTPPVVTFTVGSAGPPFTLSATASDASELTEAQFRRDGVAFTTDTAAPFEASYTPTDAGAHTLSVAVKDRFGNVGIATRTAPRDLTAPAVTLVARQWGYGVTLEANAVDTCGVTSMALAIDGTQVAKVQTGTWSAALPNSLFVPGAHVFSADVTDGCANSRHVDQPFAIYINQPHLGVTVDATVKKRPVLTVRCVHDRPIGRIDVYRGNDVVAQQTVTDTGLNPIVDITVDTSGPGWLTGWRELHVIAYDALGIPGGEWTSVLVDNTPPTVAVMWNPNGRTVVVDATPTETTSSVAKVVMSEHWYVAPITTFAPPHRLTLTVPTSAFGSYLASFSTEVKACATDTFGNEGCKRIGLEMRCSDQDHPNVCTWTEFPAP